MRSEGTASFSRRRLPSSQRVEKRVDGICRIALTALLRRPRVTGRRRRAPPAQRTKTGSGHSVSRRLKGLLGPRGLGGAP